MIRFKIQSTTDVNAQGWCDYDDGVGGYDRKDALMMRDIHAGCYPHAHFRVVWFRT